jgi:predicted DsbA family dithiol-disulfide isomerase
MPEPCVHIAEFTDPACPWAYSAEPFRHRIDWLYEGWVEWEPRMVVLADTAAEQEEKGLTPEWIADAYRRISRDHRMPIDTRERPYVAGSREACKAVVATRVHGDYVQMRTLLRELRVRNFAGELLDDPATITGAAAAAGVAGELGGWLVDPEVETELERDMRDARAPSPAARVLDHKLANWSGGRRYTCPSYEITRLSDGVRIAVPGFQPFAVYDAILANLVPGLERREPPASAAEVLDWKPIPLSTQEVAVVCAVPFDSAREELGRVATQDYVGADGFWSLEDQR